MRVRHLLWRAWHERKSFENQVQSGISDAHVETLTFIGNPICKTLDPASKNNTTPLVKSGRQFLARG